VDHATDRGKAASNDLANKYQKSKQAGVTFYETLRSDPVEQLTRLPVMVIAGLLAAGGIDGDGGVPDMDLLAGIGYHRSPFTHSIIAGAVLETAVLTLIRVVEKVHHRLPLNHDAIWDEFRRHSTAVLDAAGRGASAGIAYHLLVDGIAQPGAYHGLPIDLPIEAHQGLFVLSAGAEAQDAVVRPKSGIDLRDDHKALLEVEFALTANLRSHMMPAHVATMTSCGTLLKALADGATEPYSPQQRQFVEVAKGRRSPVREVEHAWVAYVEALEVARC